MAPEGDVTYVDGVNRCLQCGEPNNPTARFCQGCGNKLAAPGGQETRKLATVIFCDVTGSTELGERLDIEVLRRTITEYFEQMKRVIEQHGGTVEKFIGDAVMAVFGVPLVNEDDALRAVRAASQMQALMTRDPAGPASPLQVRIGINTGEVMAGDASAGHGFVTGDAVNVAARLEQAAGPGEVLIGPATYRLVRDAVEVEALEPLLLKGKSEPMPAFRLVGLLTQTRARSKVRLVGRDQDLLDLTASFERVPQSAQAEWVVVAGEAGSGKSSLVETFRSQVEDQARVLEGRCLPYGEGITFWPIAEIVRAAAGVDELDSRETARDKVSALGTAMADGDLVTKRLVAAMGLSDEVVNAQEVFWAVRSLFEHLATAKPLVVVLEDLHWAEETLLDLVEYLAAFSVDPRFMLLCATRPELLEKRSRWIGEPTLIHLRPLSREGVDQLVQELLGGSEPPPQLSAYLFEASHGNPLYLQEIIKMLIEEGVLEPVDGRWRLLSRLDDIRVPPTIQAVLTARLERLPHEERSVVQQGSVIGKDFWSGAVTALSGEESRSEIGRSLQALVRKELLQPRRSNLAGEDAFAFAHILVREAAYNALPKERRSTLHEAVAQWLRGRAGGRIREYEEVLAFHLEQAATLRRQLGHDDFRTKALSKEAGALLASSGTRALAGGDLPAAASMLVRAIALLDDEASTLGLKLDLAVAQTEMGDLAQATNELQNLLADPKASDAPEVAARARLHMCALKGLTDPEAWRTTVRDDMERCLDELKTLGDSGGQARALRLLAEWHWDHLQTASAQNLLDEALPLARAAHDSVEEGKILSFLASAAFWGPLPVGEALELCEGILASAADDRALQAKCMKSLAGLRAMRGEFVQARELAVRSEELQTELGQELALAHGTQFRGLIELMAGEPQAAVDHLRKGLEALEAMGEEAYLGTQSALLARSLFEAGDLEGAFELSVRSERATGGEETAKAEWAPSRARVMTARGDTAAALELMETVLSAGDPIENVICAGNNLTAMGEVLQASGRRDDARDYLDRALELYRHKGLEPWSVATLERLKLVGDPN